MSGPRRDENQRRYPADPKPAQPQPRRRYPADSLKPPPPPAPPPQDGQRRWDMNKKAPADWQREPKPQGQAVALGAPRDKWTGTDSIDGRAGSSSERQGMMRGAYHAGRNGDTGAAGSFPNTPEGRRMRAEYERGRQDRARDERRKRGPGIGFAEKR